MLGKGVAEGEADKVNEGGCVGVKMGRVGGTETVASEWGLTESTGLRKTIT
jgi:hypothetical protein